MSTWREDKRADRAADREQDREDRRLAAEQARKDRDAEWERARKARREKEQAKERGRARRAATRKKIRAAIAARLANDLPWLVIMAAPMVLAWSSMAAFGVDIYGPLGVLLPLFSEAVTVMIALRIPKALRAGEPVALLRLGLVVFAVAQGVMNFLHGIASSVEVIDGREVVTRPGSLVAGIVMAVVSLGGVAVHQVVHGRQPRKRRTRVERLHARRVARLRRAAVRMATPVLAPDGSVKLVYPAGRMIVTRSRFGRPKVDPAPPPSDGDRLAGEIETWLSEGAPDRCRVQPGPAETPRSTTPRVQDPDPVQEAPGEPLGPGDEPLLTRVLAAIEAGTLEPTNENVRAFLRVRKDRAYRVARAARARLGDGGEGGAPARV